MANVEATTPDNTAGTYTDIFCIIRDYLWVTSPAFKALSKLRKKAKKPAPTPFLLTYLYDRVGRIQQEMSTSTSRNYGSLVTTPVPMSRRCFFV
jgi:hypothetical protein